MSSNFTFEKLISNITLNNELFVCLLPYVYSAPSFTAKISFQTHSVGLADSDEATMPVKHVYPQQE